MIARVDVHVALAAEPRELAVLQHLQQLRLQAGCISLISSRKIVPWFAYSNLPSLRFCAPVKAPFSKPKSSLSSSSDGSAAQFTFTKGWSRRPESWCSVRATSSLPVPLSPRTSTVMSVSATCSMISRTSRIFGSSPHSSSSSASERDAAAQLLDLLLERALLERLLEGELELLDLERLAQEVGGAELHRLDDGARLAVAREHHHRHVGQSLLELPQRLEAVHAGQHDVERDEIGARCRRASRAPARRRRREDLVALARDERLRYSRTPVVVDHEHPVRTEAMRSPRRAWSSGLGRPTRAFGSSRTV